MNLEEFRKSARMVKGATKLTESPVFKEMKKVLHSESPNFQRVDLAGRKDICDDPKYQLGVIDGYNYAMRQIETMTAPKKDGVELKPTYEPPESE